MTDKKPADVVVALRQVGEAVGKGMYEFPVWFQKEARIDYFGPWRVLLNQAAEELESMQKLNGRLYKTLYGD